ncbi:MAG: PQQ-binding-like beta-propeller repeat protein [Vicinamibacterales bacterium]
MGATRRRKIGAGALAAIGLVAAVVATSGQGRPGPFTFTEAQAGRGVQLYRSTCQGCHGADLTGGPGGPALITPAFRGRWRAQPGDGLFRYMRERMPPQAPGSLSDQDYVDVMAYLVQANGVKPAGPAAQPSALAAMSLADHWPAERRQGIPLPQLFIEDATAQAALKARAERMRALRPVTDEMLRNPPRGEWLHWRRTYDAQGFSDLDQINRENVGRLGVAWSWSLAPGVNEITPLMHDGVLFAASAGTLEALDAATGDPIWKYARPGAGAPGASPGFSTPFVRNLGIYGEMVYLAGSRNVTAINMRDGTMVWDRAFADAKDNISFTAGPLVAKGKLFQGMSNCNVGYAGGCFLLALDAATGREVWRFNTLARPGEPGGDTWNGAPLEKRTGGAIWTAPSYDPELNLVYSGVGQTYKAEVLLEGAPGKPGYNDGLFTNSTLALRPETGELVWHYQHMGREVWDLDWVFERTLATLTVGGKPRRTVTTAGKMALFDTLDAATGQYLFSYDSGIQNLVVAIDPKTGAKRISAELEPKANEIRTICPSASGGGRNWPATSFNPKTGVLFVPSNETCMPFMYSPTPGAAIDIAVFATPKEGGDGMVGRVQAVDLATRKTLWTNRERAPHSSAVLATAGGLVFEGSRDRWFRALDDRTGKVLWQVRLNAPPSSYPISYSVNGVQYIAVTAGGGRTYDVNGGALTPEIGAPASGTTLWVFRLPAAGSARP